LACQRFKRARRYGSSDYFAGAQRGRHDAAQSVRSRQDPGQGWRRRRLPRRRWRKARLRDDRDPADRRVRVRRRPDADARLARFGAAGRAGRERGPQDEQALCTQNKYADEACRALDNLNQTWEPLFRQGGIAFRQPTLVFYHGGTASGCGSASAAMGPFYCPADESIYIDTTFYDQLDRELGAGRRLRALLRGRARIRPPRPER
jgi:hypothetical protein